MKNILQHRGWVSRIRLLAASVALALPVVLVPTLVATPSAQAQTLTVLYSFTGGTDGANPEAGLIRDAAGNLYGTTFYGGDLTCNGFPGCGTVFELDATGKEIVLHSFTRGADGANPVASLIRDAAGNLYGTTYYGGSSNNCSAGGCGTVFELDATGKEIVLHSFTKADGATPYAGLIRDAAGNLYGTTEHGGSSNNCSGGCGTVFELDASGKETVLHSFTGADGADSYAGLIRDAAGNLYGTTHLGGVFFSGAVFKLTLHTTGKYEVLYSFTGGTDGANPKAGLIRDAAGNLYGTTSNGGAFGHGTVFELDATGKEIVLHSFTGADGAAPIAGLIRDAAGNLYGTTFNGGVSDSGTVFKLTP